LASIVRDDCQSCPAEYSAKPVVLRTRVVRPSCSVTSPFVFKDKQWALESRAGPLTLTLPSPRQLPKVKALFRPNMNSASGPSGFPPPQVFHGTRVPLVLGSQTALLVLALLFYGLRIYSRSRPTLNFMWDDFFITLAMVSVGGKHLQSFVTLTLNSSSRSSLSA
jgi:hypothetical protein